MPWNNKDRLESLKRRIKSRKEREDNRVRSVNQNARKVEEMEK